MRPTFSLPPTGVEPRWASLMAFMGLSRLADGRRRDRGQAQVSRWRQGWARADGGVVLLGPILRDKRGAAFLSLLKAYREARAAWRAGEAANDQDSDNKAHEEIVA